MKKIFTFAAALLASISLWAVDPTYESYDWQSQEAAEAVAGNHDGIVISYAGLNDPGNVSGHWYIPNNQNLKNSDSEWKYFGIAANAQIDSVAFLYCPNGSNKTTIAWAAWGKDVTPNQYVLGHGETAGTTGSKSWESAIWETIDLTGIEAYTVYMSRNIREFREIGGSSNIPNFGGGQTINILGVRVWLAGGTPPAPSTDPVDTVIVSGATTGYVGIPVTLTATAAKADTIWWTNQSGQVQPSKDGVFTFTPDAEGEVTYTAWAENEYNENPVTTSHTINIAGKLCGELIKAVHTGSTTATVSGILKGTVDKNTQSGGKLGSNGHYFGIKLSAGKFLYGDSVTVTASKLEGGNAIDVFSDKGQTRLIPTLAIDTLVPAVFVVPEETEWIYIYRLSSATNPSIASISVTRSCSESSNANLARVYAQAGEEEQEFTQLEDTFYIEVPQEVALTSAPVHFVLEDTRAEINVANPLTMNVPAIGDAPVEQVVVVTAENGDTKNYTIRIIRRAEASHDAKLSSLSVTGYTLVPAFNPEVLEYTITKAYGSDNPGTDKLVYEKSDAAADVAKSVCASSDTLIVTVTAEDKTTVLEYKIAILEAEAPKKIYEIYMNNHYGAYIPEGQPVDSQKIYAFYLAGEQAPTVDSIKVNEGTTYAVEGDTVILTGADQSVAKYALEIAAVTPATLVVDSLYTFDGNESWIKSGYGFDAAKGGWKFSKTDTDYSREIAGKTHVEFFMPACDTILIATGDQGNERDVKFYINGAAFGEKVKLTKAGIKLAVKQSAAFMLTLASAQTSGDGGVGSIKLIEAAEPVGPTLYTVTLGTYEHGTVAFIEPNEDHKYEAGAEVRLSVTPAEGYELEAISLEGIDLAIPVEGGVATFSMPAQDVVVLATFKAVTPEPVLYTVTLGTYEHGTVAFIEPNEDHKYAEGAEVRLSVTPDEGYEVETVKLEAINQNIPVIDGVATFNMPAQDVVVLATFKPVGEGFEYIDASTKAVKFFVNGKLLIKRGDKVFDAKGQIVE